MRVITEKQLEEARNNVKLNWDAKRAIDIVLHLIPLSELQEPWMTLDEFLKSGFVGFCWINQADYIENSYFDGEIFFESSTGSHCYQTYNITHVMPIHKPEPPR